MTTKPTKTIIALVAIMALAVGTTQLAYATQTVLTRTVTAPADSATPVTSPQTSGGSCSGSFTETLSVLQNGSSDYEKTSWTVPTGCGTFTGVHVSTSINGGTPHTYDTTARNGYVKFFDPVNQGDSVVSTVTFSY